MSTFPPQHPPLPLLKMCGSIAGKSTALFTTFTPNNSMCSGDNKLIESGSDGI